MSQSDADLFSPVARRRSSERVAAAIRTRIVEGRFRPGDRLPPERTLAARFRVTRNTVREALRQLEQIRLVTIRQGSGVTVQDYLSHAGVEFLGALLGSRAETPAIVDDLLEARGVLGAAILEHSIDRADLSRIDELGAAVDALAAEAASRTPDPTALLELDIRVHEWIVRAAGNHVFVLLFNSLRRIYEPVAHLFAPVVSDPNLLVERYREAHAALARGDRGHARQVFAEVFAMGRPPVTEGRRP
jgi:GntR family transcriptional repressor for pyruvate dehydrogenase complex